MHGSHQVQFIGKLFCQIPPGRHYIDAQAQPGSIEIKHIVQQRLHASAASDQTGRSCRHFVAGVQRREIRSRRLDGLDRTAHVVSKHSQQQVTSLIYLRTEKTDRFGDCLVDGFVEADDVVQIGGVVLTLIRPLAKYAGAKRTVLGNPAD